MSVAGNVTVGAPVGMLCQPVPAGAGEAAPLITGATVSIVTLRAEDAGEAFPATSVTLALNGCEPSARKPVVKLQVPFAADVAVPRRAAPSKTLTVPLGSV